ncbi:hypothetical protein AB0H88_24800 [Nonomuraea sp. NPDC050680]|uniref:hypothetical protein n=1 Tax=Nonomuraea sp. NPDC050680 TaxID=3154630 RepID=UPI00340A7EED
MLAVLAVLGAALTTVFSYMNGHFLASVPQLVSIVLIVVALVVLTFRLPRRTSADPQTHRTDADQTIVPTPPPLNLVSHIVFGLGALVLLAFAARRVAAPVPAP